MSRNEKEQKDKEVYALERVKQMIDYYLENDSNAVVCKLLIKVREYLDQLKPNPNSNDFPDFVMDNGCLEHFAVTSSKETKKDGAKHIAKRRKFNEASLKIQKELSSERPFVKHSFYYPEHSHEYLFSSFKKNVEKHFKRIDSYKGNGENGLFLIEYMEEAALSMAENITDESDEKFGNPIVLNEYYLQRDKKILSWLYQYKEKLEYIIFLKSSGLEVLSLKKIPQLLEKLPYTYIILSNIGTVEVESFTNIDLQEYSQIRETE